MRAVCLGTTTLDVACGIELQEFDWSGPPEVPFKTGRRQGYRSTETEGSVLTRTVTLDCIDGCECVVDADCDVSRVCTRDSCSSGNCENTPDDTIKPEQVDDDCRVRTVRLSACES